MEPESTISQLIEFVTSDQIETPDINAQIEIASRMVDNKKDMVIGLREIDKLLRKSKIKRKYLALCLLEIWSKNGDISIHELITKKQFLDSFMTLLKKRRGKKGLLQKSEKGMDKWYKEKAEIKALYLIQLWADTFMMHQDKFSGVHEWYRILRKEGVEFPERDPNERLMMENLKGIDSPMFDFIEQSAGKEKPKQLEEIKKSKQIEENNKVIDIIENDETEEIQAFEENEDFSRYLRDNYDRTEFEVAKSTITILEDMANNAEHINDLRTEVVKDIYTTWKVSRIRIAKIVEVRSFSNKTNDLEALLECIDFLDKKLDAFRVKYKKLKLKEEARIQKQKVKDNEKAELKAKKKAELKAKEKAKKVEAKKQEVTTKHESSDEEESEEEESEEDEFDQYNKEDAAAEEIGNIDLLDLGLGPSPEKNKSEEKSKKKKDKKKKLNKKKSEDKKQEEPENKDGDKENKDEIKPIKKLIAPPSGQRKLVNPPKPEEAQNQPKVAKPDLMDLLEF